jgi:hypothetical protein
MLTAFPNGTTYSPLHNNGMDYNTINHDYNAIINKKSVIAGATDLPFNPITAITGDPFGMAPLNILLSAFVGLEAMLLTLANIFPMFAIMFILFAAIAFIVKLIVIAYFASILIRSIFGGSS